MVLALSIILSYTGLILLLLMITDGFRINFDPVKSTYSPDGSNELDIGNIERLTLMMETYSQIQSFNAFFILLRLLFDFGFSKELYFLIELISAALLDILFFALMFALVYFFNMYQLMNKNRSY